MLDKYQAKVASCLSAIKFEEDPWTRATDRKRFNFEQDFSKIVLCKSDNYEIVEYKFSFVQPNLQKIVLGKGKDAVETKADKEGNATITFDFRKALSPLTFYFKNDLCDPISMEIVYNESDHESWDKKVAEKIQEEKERKVDFQVAKGMSLINVFFNPVNENFAYAIASLYLRNKNGTLRFLGSYRSQEGFNFISINGLADTCFYVSLEEFDKEGNELFRSKMLLSIE